MINVIFCKNQELRTAFSQISLCDPRAVWQMWVFERSSRFWARVWSSYGYNLCCVYLFMYLLRLSRQLLFIWDLFPWSHSFMLALSPTLLLSLSVAFGLAAVLILPKGHQTADLSFWPMLFVNSPERTGLNFEQMPITMTSFFSLQVSIRPIPSFSFLTFLWWTCCRE